MATEEEDACSCGEALRPDRLAARSCGDRLPTPPMPLLAESDGVADDDGDAM